MFGLRRKIAAAARTAAVGTISGLLALTGLAFLTFAGWLLLTATHTPLFAASVIGGVYLGFALIGFALIASDDPGPSHSAPSSPVTQGDLSPLQLVALSFIDGLEQGQRAKKQS